MPNLSIRWRSRPDISKLEHEIDALKIVVIRLRRDLTDKTGYAGRLEVLLRERLARIDELTAKVDQLRAVNARLDAEAERLCEMVRMS
jgi:hypothetical protein